MPPTNMSGTQIAMDTNGSSFHSACAQNAPYMPSMTRSPCARLMMRMTPKTTVSPTPIMA